MFGSANFIFSPKKKEMILFNSSGLFFAGISVRIFFLLAHATKNPLHLTTTFLTLLFT